MRGSHALALSCLLIGLAVGFLLGWSLAGEEVSPSHLGGETVSPAAPPATPSAIGSDPAPLPAVGPQSDRPEPAGAPAAALPSPQGAASAPRLPPPPLGAGGAAVRVTVLRHDGTPEPEFGLFCVRPPDGVSAEKFRAWYDVENKKVPNLFNSLRIGGGTTTGDGVLEIPVPKGGRVYVGFWGPGYGSTHELHTVAGERSRLQIQLPAPARFAISGTAWTAEGDRLNGAEVRVRWKVPGTRWATAKTDARGGFVLPRLKPHPGGAKPELLLQVQHGGGAFTATLKVFGETLRVQSYSSDGRAMLVRGGRDPVVELAMPTPRHLVTVQGTLNVPAGVDMRELSIQWTADDPETEYDESEDFPTETRPDANGRFEFEAPAPARVRLVAYGDECGSEDTFVVVQAGDPPRSVTLLVVPRVRPAVEVHGGDGRLIRCDPELHDLNPRVADEDGNMPILGFGPAADLDDDGRVRIPWGLEGRWRLTVHPQDHLKWQRRSVEFDGPNPPSSITVIPMVPVLEARVQVDGARRGPVDVQGRWRCGAETGEFDWEWGEAEDQRDVIRIACEAPKHEVTIELALRMAGFRPVRFGPVKLSEGRPLEPREIVFKRD